MSVLNTHCVAVSVVLPASSDQAISIVPAIGRAVPMIGWFMLRLCFCRRAMYLFGTLGMCAVFPRIAASVRRRKCFDCGSIGTLLRLFVCSLAVWAFGGAVVVWSVAGFFLRLACTEAVDT